MIVYPVRAKSNLTELGRQSLVFAMTDNEMYAHAATMAALLLSSSDHSEASPVSNSGYDHEPGTRGRPALHVLYPEILDMTKEFLHLGGESRPQAQDKRRTCTSQLGHSIPEILRHLKTKLGPRFPATLSLSTVRRMFVSPHESRRSAVLYKGLIDCKPPTKHNDLRKFNVDAQFANSSVALGSELFALHSDESLTLSLDTMNAVKVGPLAVTCYHQITLFFLEGHAPIVEDHDWPVNGYHIEVGGVLILTGHTNETNPGRFTGLDRHGRIRQVIQTCGPGHVFLRASLFHPKTVVNHILNVYEVLKVRMSTGFTEPTVLLVKVDGGSDLTPDSIINLLFWGRLWLATGNPIFLVMTHAAGWSALNDIEHLWSPLSKQCAGLQFSACLPGEDKPPCQNSTLSRAECFAAEAKVFDTAINQLATAMGTLVWAGHQIACTPVPCVPTEVPAPPAELPATAKLSAEPPKTSDYGVVHDVLTQLGVGIIAATSEYKAVMDELKFFLSHASKRRYATVFVACKKPGCKCGGHLAN